MEGTREMTADELVTDLELQSSQMEYGYAVSDWKLLSNAATMLRQQQAEIERLIGTEPVAIRYDFDGYGYKYMDSGTGSDWQTRVKGEPLYTAPQSEKYPQIAINPEIVGYVAPQRTWVGLTDEEIKAFDTWHDNREEEVGWCNPSEIVAYIEAKLRSKNNE